MGCRADLTFPAYRKYRLELLAEQMQKSIFANCVHFIRLHYLHHRSDPYASLIVQSFLFLLLSVLSFCFKLLACILSCHNKRILIEWLIDPSIDRLIDRSIDWLIDWLIDRLIDWLHIPSSVCVCYYSSHGRGAEYCNEHVCLSVCLCLCVSPWSYLWNYTCDIHQIFCVCYLLPSMVLELIPVLGSLPAGDVSHKPDVGLSLLTVRPAVTLETLNIVATNFYAL